MPDLSDTFRVLGLAAGLGLLVGLQRQWSGSRIAGVRTFPLVTVAGALAALLGAQFGDPGVWIIAAGVMAMGALAIAANLILARAGGNPHPGMTTEVAIVAMYLLGAYATVGRPAIVTAIGVGIAILLQAKASLHGLAGRIGERDMRAIMLFAAITFIILPLLPDRVILQQEMGALAVWNPRNIWLMVVLVAGVSLAGYIVYKMVGERAGTIVNGLLGGVISSTATTVAFTRRAAAAQRQGDSMTGEPLLVIVIAGSVVYARLLLSIAIVAPVFLPQAAPPLLTMLTVSGACALATWMLSKGAMTARAHEHDNPTELKSALVFAGLYALVLLGVAAARVYLGDRGLFVVSAFSGLTDMDAITLSTSRLVADGSLAATLAWRAIIIASMSNIIFKACVVTTLGPRKLATGLWCISAIKLAAGVALLVWWR